MDKFGQISTELLTLIRVEKMVSELYLAHFRPITFKLCMWVDILRGVVSDCRWVNFVKLAQSYCP